MFRRNAGERDHTVKEQSVGQRVGKKLHFTLFGIVARQATQHVVVEECERAGISACIGVFVLAMRFFLM